MQTKWIAVAAASAIGLSSIAAGAMSVASAVEIRDAQGHAIGAAPIRGDIIDRGAATVKTAGDHVSIASATHAPTAASAPSATEAPAADGPAAQPAPQQAPAPVAVPSADSVHSAASAG